MHRRLVYTEKPTVGIDREAFDLIISLTGPNYISKEKLSFRMCRWLAFTYCSKAAVTSVDPGHIFALKLKVTQLESDPSGGPSIASRGHFLGNECIFD